MGLSSVFPISVFRRIRWRDQFRSHTCTRDCHHNQEIGHDDPRNPVISLAAAIGNRLLALVYAMRDTLDALASRSLPLRSLDMSYFAVDGLVSGIKSQRIAAPSTPIDEILRNAAVRPKLTAIRPKSAVLSAAPIPDAGPMMRAFLVVNCQSALVWLVLRSCSQAAISSMRVCLSGMR